VFRLATSTGRIAAYEMTIPAGGATVMPTLFARSAGPDITVDDVVVVGRHPQCDARFNSLGVSRRHCILSSTNGEVLVRDLGSANGTWINGRRVAEGRLRPGDEIWIAHFRYRFEKPAAARPRSENAPTPAGTGSGAISRAERSRTSCPAAR
jgi:pSer/pThr/pTyr-binding forkhead associated (FHA) protein